MTERFAKIEGNKKSMETKNLNHRAVIQNVLDLDLPDSILEAYVIRYLENLHGKGLQLVLHLLNGYILRMLTNIKFRAKYSWNVKVKGKSDRLFLANEIGMTEAEIAAAEGSDETN